MQKLLIIAAVVLVCLPALMTAKGAARPRKVQGERTPAQPRDCGQWTEGQCVAKNNNTNCGAGTKIKSRTGDNCPVKEKTLKCKIPCAADGTEVSTGGRGRPRPGKSACKYTKGQWSECDAATNMRTRTLTLKPSNRRNAPAATTECEPTKTMSKRCPPAGSNRKGPANRRNRGQ